MDATGYQNDMVQATLCCCSLWKKPTKQEWQ